MPPSTGQYKRIFRGLKSVDRARLHAVSFRRGTHHVHYYACSRTRARRTYPRWAPTRHDRSGDTGDVSGIRRIVLGQLARLVVKSRSARRFVEKVRRDRPGTDLVEVNAAARSDTTYLSVGQVLPPSVGMATQQEYFLWLRRVGMINHRTFCAFTSLERVMARTFRPCGRDRYAEERFLMQVPLVIY
jgi:hypothetical protein